MRVITRSLLALLCCLPACTEDTGARDAMCAFAAFQDALQRGDESACRTTLTAASAEALPHVPWQRVREQRPLSVLGAERRGSEFRVRVADPNADGREAEFVVVREYGRMVVDLVATAGLTARAVEASGSTAEQFEPRELTPADFDRIRAHELAQPPR
jgi:hypothetical protein